MFEVLLESRGVRAPRPTISTLASLAAHAAILAGTISGGHFLFDQRRTAQENEFLTEMVRYLVPPDRKAAPYSERLQYTAVTGGSSAAGIIEGRTRTVSDNGLVGTGTAGENRPGEMTDAPIPQPSKANDAFSVLDVDSAAVRDPDSASPDYPKALLEKGIEGYAAMRFVVDTTGRIDMATVQVIDASHNEFVRAVKDVMPKMHFRPARIGRLLVRQLAEQMFKFEVKTVGNVLIDGKKRPGDGAH